VSAGMNMTADQLERHIKDCGDLMSDAYARFEVSGLFSDRGDADRWQMAMARAIAARSPAQVATLEMERGLV